MMTINKIRYKGKVTFDYFEIWLDEDISVSENETFEFTGDFNAKALSVSTKICPWCIKKYGLYSEAERTPESVEEELSYYENDNPEDLDFTCGVDGCINGAADYVDLNWEGFEIEESDV